MTTVYQIKLQKLLSACSQARQNKLFSENRLHIYACDKGFYGKDRSQLNRGDKITKNFLDEKLHTCLTKIQSSHSQNVEKKKGKKKHFDFLRS